MLIGTPPSPEGSGKVVVVAGVITGVGVGSTIGVGVGVSFGGIELEEEDGITLDRAGEREMEKELEGDKLEETLLDPVRDAEVDRVLVKEILGVSEVLEVKLVDSVLEGVMERVTVELSVALLVGVIERETEGVEGWEITEA
jgi:hypothetical protein